MRADTASRPPARGRAGRRWAMLATVVVTAVLATGLAACGDGGEEGSAPGAGDTAPTTEAAAGGTGGAPPSSGSRPDDTAGPGSGGGDAGPGGWPDAGLPPNPSTDVAAASGDAPAAAGAGLDEPPGDPARVPHPGFGEGALAVTGPDGTSRGFCVLLALAAEQRRRGLMEVTDLQGYDGMLFAFPEDTRTGFWMSNTPQPLSIAWVDADGELVSTEDMTPCEEGDACPTYPPAGPYRFALEVPQGELPALGVEPGSRLAVGGPCAAGPS